MADVVTPLRPIDFQQIRRPKGDAVQDRCDGIPAGTSWTTSLRVGRPWRFPRGFQHLSSQRLPCPFGLGGQASRTLVRAPAFRHPRAPQRGGLAGARPRASPPESLGRGARGRPIDPRRVLAAMGLAHTPHRSPTGVPGLAPQVWACVSRADMAPLRGLGHALVEAADMPMDLLPGDGLPGRPQARAILGGGSSPRPPLFPLQHPGPTSAYPGRSSRHGLLRASCAPAVCGWHRRGEVTASPRAAGGDAGPSFPWLPPEDGAVHRVSWPCRPVSGPGCRRLLRCHVGPSVSASDAGGRARWLTDTCAGAVHRCLRDGRRGLRLPRSAVAPRFRPLRTSRRPGG